MGTSSATSTRHPFVPPDPPRTPKSADTRRRILDLAATLFIQRGYSAVSMNDIAGGAGLTKGALYGHFRAKGQLLVEVIRDKIAERDHGATFAAAMRGPDPAVGLFFDAEGRDVRLLEVDAAAAARHDPDVAAGLAELYDDRIARIREAMAGADDPATAAWLVAVLSGGIGMKEAARLPLPDADRLSAALRGVLRSVT